MQSVNDFPWEYAHLVASGLVNTGQGALHSIVVNGLTTAGDITIYDNTEAAGTAIIAILHLDPTTSVSVQPITFLYDIKYATGLYISYDQSVAADLTVSFK